MSRIRSMDHASQRSSNVSGSPALVPEISRDSEDVHEDQDLNIQDEGLRNNCSSVLDTQAILRPSQSLLREHSAFAALID